MTNWQRYWSWLTMFFPSQIYEKSVPYEAKRRLQSRSLTFNIYSPLSFMAISTSWSKKKVAIKIFIIWYLLPSQFYDKVYHMKQKEGYNQDLHRCDRTHANSKGLEVWKKNENKSSIWMTIDCQTWIGPHARVPKTRNCKMDGGTVIQYRRASLD